MDSVDTQFEARFSQPDFKVLQELKNVLLTGAASSVTNDYPELDSITLKVQLCMFHSKYKVQSISDAAVLFRSMTANVRGLFDQVEPLLRLLLVMPVSSSFQCSEEAENMAHDNNETGTVEPCCRLPYPPGQVG